MKKIAVIYGGVSAEKEVSISTGTKVITALKSFDDYEILPFQLTEDIYAFVDFLKQTQPDIVFNALHGTFGEDGHIQSLLNLLNIPYTHSGMKASCLAFDKSVASSLCKAAGIKVPHSIKVLAKEIKDYLPFEQDKVIKPVSDGSSVAVFIIKAGIKNLDHIDLSSWLDTPFLIEDYIKGREFTVNVDNGKASVITEILTEHQFYDYSAKYDAGGSKHIIPAQLSKETTQKILHMAEKAYAALGCRGIARVDFIKNEHDIHMLEINTQPGMTPTSLTPEQKAYEGVSYAQLCRLMVEQAGVD